ncbi:MAG TPA: glycosyltransferase family 4 protein [Solirubrobacterales bacterium]|jgi:glycosyltransferase involved in cell wall biosynthesis|nr:glycosyltransferase family 4 protein [Solirubrobacterales bacterium]
MTASTRRLDTSAGGSRRYAAPATGGAVLLCVALACALDPPQSLGLVVAVLLALTVLAYEASVGLEFTLLGVAVAEPLLRNRIRILFVHPLAEQGGSENVLVRLIRTLDSRFEPTVLLMRRGPFERVFAEMDVPCHSVSLPGKRSVLAFPSTAAALARRFGTGHDLIHANGTKAALFSTFLARRLDVPLLWMKHAHDFESWGPRVVGPECDRIACVSAAVASPFSESLRDRIIVCHPGVPLPAETTPAASTDPIVVSVGRIDPHKGFDNLIRAVGLLRDRGIAGRIKIGGPPEPKAPEHRDELIRLIAEHKLEDRAEVLGWVDDIQALYDEARVVALGSRAPDRRARGVEGAPLVLLEGMSHARAVVAPDDGGIAEIVGDAGSLVDAPEPDQLAAALGRYLADADLAQQTGTAARKRVEAGFTIEQMTHLLEREYAQLAGRPYADPAPPPTIAQVSLPR